MLAGVNRIDLLLFKLGIVSVTPKEYYIELFKQEVAVILLLPDFKRYFTPFEL